ncbi:MAG: hypothetical protein LV479_07840 [Methylacidiphilales bacterium]|nr:hypothetical protein [Candidatus Methylacidiphilales bacterium]
MLLAAAPFIMLPESVLHGDLLSITWFEALLFPAFVIGVLFYLYRLATYALGGSLVHQELLTLHLPNKQRQPLVLPQCQRGKVIIFLHNAKLSWLHGQFCIKRVDQSRVLSDMQLKEPKGRVVKNMHGEEQRILGGKGAARANQVAMLSFSKDKTSANSLLLELNLDWNFQGWNSSLEQRLPKDRNLIVEVLVRAA